MTMPTAFPELFMTLLLMGKFEVDFLDYIQVH